LAFFIDLKEKKEERSLPELILPEDYQKGRREDGKKNVSAAIRVIFDNPDDCLFIIGEYFNHYRQILENSSRKFSEISVFRAMTRTVLLENSSKTRSKNNISQIPGRDTDRITENMDEFSSDTFWLRLLKAEISENFLDDFSRICQ